MNDSIVNRFKSYFHAHEEHHAEQAEIVVTSPKEMDVTITKQFVCQIHSKQHIDVCALEGGYLEEISINEGQTVKKGDVMFKILPVLYSTKAAAEVAEAKVAQLEYEYTQEVWPKIKSSSRERSSCSTPNGIGPRQRPRW